MSRRQAGLILSIVRTDRSFELSEVRGERAWVGRCIHCNAHLVVSLSGVTLATVEHIEPTTHGGTDEVANLALACARCNQTKGARLDHRRREDPTLSAVIETLRQRRQARWRDDPTPAPQRVVDEAPKTRRRRPAR